MLDDGKVDKYPHAIVYANENGACIHGIGDGDRSSECGDILAVVYEDGSEGTSDEARQVLQHHPVPALLLRRAVAELNRRAASSCFTYEGPVEECILEQYLRNGDPPQHRGRTVHTIACHSTQPPAGIAFPAWSAYRTWRVNEGELEEDFDAAIASILTEAGFEA